MRHRRLLLCLALALVVAEPALAQSRTAKPQDVVRKEQGNRISENIPEIPADLIERLNRYQNTRGASLAGWTKEGCPLISTRFAETA